MAELAIITKSTVTCLFKLKTFFLKSYIFLKFGLFGFGVEFNLFFGL